MDVRKIILALLLASAWIHSEKINPADADYCIDWRSEENEIYTDQDSVRLVLVKKNSNFKIRLNTNGPIKCREHYHSLSSSEYYLVNEFGKKKIYFIGWAEIDERLSATYSWCSCEPDVTRIEPEFVKTLPREIQFVFPETTGKLRMWLNGEYKKEELLSIMKGQIIDAYKDQTIHCPPNLDTTFIVNFRVKITGECAADVLKKYDSSQRRGAVNADKEKK
jgi:hypothetical protein